MDAPAGARVADRRPTANLEDAPLWNPKAAANWSYFCHSNTWRVSAYAHDASAT